ncbi:MAG: hypothetical protein KME50_16915 [Nostoc desertorum CM1-VF14]|nr:hypothetical protein [Nostoc desertorum CM1-VF14]
MFYFSTDVFGSNGQLGTEIFAVNQQKEKHIETGVSTFLVSLITTKLQTKCISIEIMQLSQAIARDIKYYQ